MAERTLQKVEDQLNCVICLDKYEDPKFLQCFHYYCKKCLAKLPKGKTELSCPECRQITQLPANGVAGLKSAFHINRLLGIFQEDPKEDKRFCSEHADEELKMYCETCGKLICLKCVTTNSKCHGHNYELLNEAFQKYRNEINSSKMLVSKQMSNVAKALEQLATHQHKIVSQQATVEAEICEQNREAQIAGQLQQMTKSKLKRIEAQKLQLKTTESQLKSCYDFMTKSLESNSFCDVLEMKASVIRKIKELTVPIQPESGNSGSIIHSGFIASCPSKDIFIYRGK